MRTGDGGPYQGIFQPIEPKRRANVNVARMTSKDETRLVPYGLCLMFYPRLKRAPWKSVVLA